jgi:hypothetical protein
MLCVLRIAFVLKNSQPPSSFLDGFLDFSVHTGFLEIYRVPSQTRAPQPKNDAQRPMHPKPTDRKTAENTNPTWILH